jgi:GNAT superfamily N-acetyltransferase
LAGSVTLRIERLSRAHRPLLDGFVNDEPDLVAYLRRWALVHQERDHLGRTWLALDEAAEVRIAGFFTLAAASLDRGAVNMGDLARLPRFPIPAVLLARLAVDSRVQGQGLGTWLFDEALQRTLVLAAEGPIGFRVLVTDAKNERAAAFYERRGLVVLTDPWPRRLVLDLKPLVPRRSGCGDQG